MLTIVKVGGSLYDLPDLGQRLRDWLRTLTAERILLVPGGGRTADVIRELDAIHQLGEQKAHAVALQTLTLNAWFLATLLGKETPVLNPWRLQWQGLALLDAGAFCREPEVAAGLPACWETTSDSVAAQAALMLQADELVLLKSAGESEVLDWHAASRQGLVDRIFPTLLEKAQRQGRLHVRLINFRSRLRLSVP
jgi:aspartokinase-like uncharacterized kinase